MAALTIALAVLTIFLVLKCRPLTGLLVYLGLLCWYSAWQPVTIGGVNLTAPRLVIPILLWRAASDRAIMRRFKWMAVDYAVLVLSAAEVAAGLFTTDIGQLFQNRAGSFFDTAMLYFAARMTVVTQAEFTRFLKGLLVIAAPLALLGAYQSATGSNPWGVFVNQGAAFEGSTVISKWAENSRRFGLYRANVNFPYSITFGFFFALGGTVAAGAWHYVTGARRMTFMAGLALMGVGMISSMSSGPLLAGGTAFMMAMGWPFRRYWKATVALVILGLVAIDIGSNRHWYDVLGWYLAFNAHTAAYRVEVIKETFSGGMSGHWLFGFGLVSPSNIHDIARQWQHTDITNHMVYQIMRFGLIGFAPWITVIILAIWRLRAAYAGAVSLAQQWLIWCLGAAIGAALASMMSACWEGQAHSLLWAVFGLAANTPLMVQLSLRAGASSGVARQPAIVARPMRPMPGRVSAGRRGDLGETPVA